MHWAAFGPAADVLATADAEVELVTEDSQSSGPTNHLALASASEQAAYTRSGEASYVRSRTKVAWVTWLCVI
jgi:hypothetical protein